MSDLFLGCAYVRTYVRMYMHIGHAQEYQFAVMLRNSDVTDTQEHRYRTQLGEETTFFGNKEWEDSAAGPLQRTYLAESSAETSAECLICS